LSEELLVQRHPVSQSVLDLEEDFDSQIHCAEGYIDRAITTNLNALSDSEIIHWYNQRAEDSENRIKELKLDLVVIPCPVLILTPTPCTSALLHCLTIHSS
jgi:hypothetical protein